MFSICMLMFVFFFKQKTAYEMRISDWSSDVCSSDLRDDMGLRQRDRARHRFVRNQPRLGISAIEPVDDRQALDDRLAVGDQHRHEELGRASCRERVCQYV